ncbi:hypothetical protein GQ37_012210 [Janthinobacterium sp. BJB1]|nr:hypothetical protein GQ37_012210 [Janthinobacterium sp. BJB1]
MAATSLASFLGIRFYLKNFLFPENDRYPDMKKIILIILSLFILAACNAREKEERLQKELSEQTFTTTSYNYTPYDLYAIAFKEISLPFNIDDAPSGGSVFFRDASEGRLDNGEKVAFSSGNCCLSWDRPVDKPLRVRVVWSVVFDMRYHDGQSSISYDERTSRQGSPGSRWCQAIVDILPSTGPDRPTSVLLHFLADGTVQARLGTFKTAAPLAAAEVKLHATRLPQGQFCRQEIENPFYGIPRKPHRE